MSKLVIINDVHVWPSNEAVQTLKRIQVHQAEAQTLVDDLCAITSVRLEPAELTTIRIEIPA